MRVCDCFETAVHVGFKHRWMMLPQSYPIACLWCFCKCVFFGFCALLPSCGLFPSSSYLVSPSPSLQVLSRPFASSRLVCWLSFSSPSSYTRLFVSSVGCRSLQVPLPVSSVGCRFRRQVLRLSSRLVSSVGCVPPSSSPWLSFPSPSGPFSVWSAPLALFCNACPRIRPIPSTVKVHPSRRCCLCAYPCVTESRRHGHSQAPAPRGTPSSSVLSPVLCDNSPPLSRSSPSGPTPIRFWTWLASVFSVSLSISTISYPSPPRVRLLCLCAVWHPLCPS
jgi:hypothetical protein